MIIGIESGQLVGALALGGTFGALYALLTHWMRARGHLRGVTSYQVMWGVMVTLAINKLIHHPEPLYDFFLELLTFAATGLPMIIEHQLTYFFENQHAQQEEDRRVNEAIEREERP